MPTRDIDDIRLAFDDSGSEGPTLVLLHGLAGSRKTWLGLVPWLDGRCRVIVPDLRGCGESTRGTAEYTLARAADDVAALTVALGIRSYIPVGHSLGGVIAQDLLTRHADCVAAAVLVSTSSRVSEKASQNWVRLAELVEAKGISDSPAAQARSFAEAFVATHPEVLAHHAKIAAATDPKVYGEQARAASRYDYTEALSRVTCPVLVVQGLADRLTPPGGSVLLQRAIPGSTLEMVADAGHNLPIEMPAEFSALVLDFAARCAN